MSRTYRKIPYWCSEKRLRAAFNEGCGHWGFHRSLNRFTEVDAYVIAATAHFRGERGSGWQAMKDGVGPNGNVIGWGESPRGRDQRRFTNKIRRSQGRAEIREALAEMSAEATDDLAEWMNWEMDERDNFEDDHWTEWDDWEDDRLEDERMEAEYESMEDDYYSDPFWDMDYDYDYR